MPTEFQCFPCSVTGNPIIRFKFILHNTKLPLSVPVTAPNSSFHFRNHHDITTAIAARLLGVPMATSWDCMLFHQGKRWFESEALRLARNLESALTPNVCVWQKSGKKVLIVKYIKLTKFSPQNIENAHCSWGAYYRFLPVPGCFHFRRFISRVGGCRCC